MRKIIVKWTSFLVISLFICFSSCFAVELPGLLTGKDYKAKKLPKNMTDIWVHFRKYDKGIYSDPVLIFRDSETDLQGIANLSGKVKLKPQCAEIFADYGIYMSLKGRPTQMSAGRILMCSDTKLTPDYFPVGKIIDTKSFKVTDEMFGNEGHGFDGGPYMTDGLVPFYNESGLYGYLDKNGNEVISPKYQNAAYFDSGYAAVEVKGKWSIIDHSGKMVFRDGAWKEIYQAGGREFVAQLPTGEWYKLDLPVSDAKTSSALSSSSGSKVGNCPYPTRLKVGDQAQVIGNTGVKLRKSPNGEETGQQAYRYENRYMKLIDGPVCSANRIWYEVEFNGHKGWAAEVWDNGNYLYEKVAPSQKKSQSEVSVNVSKKTESDSAGRTVKGAKMKTRIQKGDMVKVVNASSLVMYPAYDSTYYYSDGNHVAFPGPIAKVLDGPKIREGCNFYEISFNGWEGWVCEGANGTYYLEKVHIAP